MLLIKLRFASNQGTPKEVVNKANEGIRNTALLDSNEEEELLERKLEQIGTMENTI